MFDTYVGPQIEKQRDVFDPTRRENFQEERIFGLRRRTENAKKRGRFFYRREIFGQRRIKNERGLAFWRRKHLV